VFSKAFRIVVFATPVRAVSILMAFTQFSPSDKQCALADFKRVADERCPGHVNGFSNEAPVNDPVLEDESDPTRKEFFASGAENWLSVLEDLTFPSVSLPLSMDMATAFAQGKLSAQQHNALAHAIDDTLAEKGWPQVFVKLSTRSPKDAPQILQKASATFIDRGGLSLAANERCALFSDLVQENFSVSSGNEAVDLLLASERIHEDCAYAIEAQNYDELGVHIVLRRWDGAIPSSNEFRGIVWQGKMNAVSQYYHPLYFPQLEGVRATIVQDLGFVFDKIEPKLREAGFSNYIIDFAWLGPDKVRVIEVNPFDGVSLGTMAASTCLFSWEF